MALGGWADGGRQWSADGLAFATFRAAGRMTTGGNVEKLSLCPSKFLSAQILHRLESSGGCLCLLAPPVDDAVALNFPGPPGRWSPRAGTRLTRHEPWIRVVAGECFSRWVSVVASQPLFSRRLLI